MVRSRKVRQFAEAATRGLLLHGRDRLLLMVCIVGLLAAWLFYGAFGAGRADIAGPTAGTAATGTAEYGRTAPASSSPRDDARTTPQASAAPITAPPVVRGPIASAPQRISYPAAGMDVVVHPLQPDAESQSIVPPETMDGYWLSTFGSPGAGSTNTTYIIGHSWEGLDAPFNHLSSAAAPGDRFAVTTATGVVEYTVDSVATYTKSTLKDSSVWTAVPNRLVLISCYTEDLWGENLVVTASPAGGK